MRIFCVVPRGLEPVACLDAKELVSKDAESGDGWIAFDVKDVKEAMRFAYRSQSVSKVIVSAAESDPSKDQDIEAAFQKMVSQVDWDDVLPKGLSFAARATKVGEEDLPSPDIAAMVGGLIKDKTGSIVNLKAPDVLISAYVGHDRMAFGLDLSGDDLAKRPYRIFLQGQALKAPLAYALVRESGWAGKGPLLDPFCQAGTVPIEAALWASGQSPNRFAKERLLFTRSPLFKDLDIKSILLAEDSAAVLDPLEVIAMDESFRSISSSKKNAKLAGVEKLISFSKLDVEWLDVKFGKRGLDFIASFPPMPSRLVPQAKLDGVYSEFLRQCAYILSKKGKVAILSRTVAPWLRPVKDNGFRISNSRPVWQGKEQMMLIVLEKE